jgi:hypothetical protein
MISLNMVAAVRVRIAKPIDPDSWVEKGMVAWLTDIVWNDRAMCYELFFDFTDFEPINLKYLKRTYFPNSRTAAVSTTRQVFTAIEAGMYDPYQSAYLSVPSDTRNDAEFEQYIQQYLIRLWSEPTH